MSNVIELIIADDHSLFVDGLQLLLKDETDIAVIGIANDGKELLNILPKRHPYLILLDINMPKLNGLETTRYIKQSYPLIKIIILSTYNDEHLIDKAKSLGVNGYLLKTTNKEELLQTIRLVNSGQACFPYRKASQKNEFDSNDLILRRYSLTKREMEILNFIKEGKTNHEIADELYLSVYTVETHRKNIMQKLGLKSPAALFKFLSDLHEG